MKNRSKNRANDLTTENDDRRFLFLLRLIEIEKKILILLRLIEIEKKIFIFITIDRNAEENFYFYYD